MRDTIQWDDRYPLTHFSSAQKSIQNYLPIDRTIGKDLAILVPNYIAYLKLHSIAFQAQSNRRKGLSPRLWNTTACEVRLMGTGTLRTDIWGTSRLS